MALARLATESRRFASKSNMKPSQAFTSTGLPRPAQGPRTIWRFTKSCIARLMPPRPSAEKHMTASGVSKLSPVPSRHSNLSGLMPLMTRTVPRGSAETQLMWFPLYTRLKPQTRPRRSSAARSLRMKPGFARFEEKPVRLSFISVPSTAASCRCASRIQPPVKVVIFRSRSARSRLRLMSLRMLKPAPVQTSSARRVMTSSAG